MLKNTENQKWIVFAFDSTTSLGLPGDAANITANLRKDYGGANALADTNPTELEDGFYAFDLVQAETFADHLLLCPQSSTPNIVVIACPAVIYTEPTGRKYDLVDAPNSTAITAFVAAMEAEIADDATGAAVKQAIIDKLIENLPDIDDLTLSSIAQSVWEYTTRALTDKENFALSTDYPKLTDLDGLATSTNVSDAQTAIIEAMPSEPPTVGQILGDMTPYKGVANSLAKAIFEINQRLNGLKVVIDEENGTIKIYDTNGTTLLFTLTKAVAGNVYTITRS